MFCFFKGKGEILGHGKTNRSCVLYYWLTNAFRKKKSKANSFMRETFLPQKFYNYLRKNAIVKASCHMRFQFKFFTLTSSIATEARCIRVEAAIWNAAIVKKLLYTDLSGTQWRVYSVKGGCNLLLCVCVRVKLITVLLVKLKGIFW